MDRKRRSWSQRYNDKSETYNQRRGGNPKRKPRPRRRRVELRGHQASRLDIGEIFLEIAIVFASLAILTKRPLLYWTAVVSGLVGTVTACTTF